jgi:GNAT superfamily N-acetyltransferase
VSASAVLIRPADARDAAELARLRWEFRVELDPPVEEQSGFVTRCTGWMRKEFEAKKAWRCWVAATGTKLVGTIWLQLIEKLPNPVGHLDYHGYVSSVYVVPAHRNDGIGSALLRACLAQCDERGVDAVFLWPTARSRPLYQRHGFVVRNDLLERRNNTP